MNHINGSINVNVNGRNYRVQRSELAMRNLFRIAYNFVAPVNVEALTVKRKGKVIRGETDANLAAAYKERNMIRNAAKRERRARR